VVVLLAASFLKMPAQVVMGAFYGLYIVMFIALVDAVLLGYRVRRKAQERFGESARKGAVMYVVMRAFQLRRTRLPKPQVKRGDFPGGARLTRLVSRDDGAARTARVCCGCAGGSRIGGMHFRHLGNSGLKI